MIYAMPGMQSQLHAVMNVPGDYEGFSSNYSGAGFSGMRFRFHGLDPGRLRRLGRQGPRSTASRSLDRAGYLDARQAERERRRRRLRRRRPRSLPTASSTAASRRAGCASTEMMALDAHGGTGLAGHAQHHPRRGPAGERLRHERRSTSPSSAPPRESVEQYGRGHRRPARPRPRRRRAGRDETL